MFLNGLLLFYKLFTELILHFSCGVYSRKLIQSPAGEDSTPALGSLNSLKIKRARDTGESAGFVE
ncbi:hypothetical protein KIS4809_3224 [Bacillus sp. ZZV12-4809]|nr:hypothetical protein KIS4809_3224 [Bacillus sp. ZZV12-4809]